MCRHFTWCVCVSLEANSVKLELMSTGRRLLFIPVGVSVLVC